MRNGRFYLVDFVPIDVHGQPWGRMWLHYDITERKQVVLEREGMIQQLRQALLEVKTLSGLLPICASCKKIRDDKGYWNQIENYISVHSDAQFSHGICPDCARQPYPDFFK